MRVVFCQPSSAKGSFSGPERQTVQIGRALRERGHEVVVGVILVHPEEKAEETTLGVLAQQAGLTVDTLYLPQRYNLWASARAFRRFVDTHQPDVVCVAGYKADIVAAIAPCVPTVAWTPGWTAVNWKVKLFEWLDRRLLYRHGSVITVSLPQRDLVVSMGVPAGKVFYLPTALDMQHIPEAYTKQQMLTEVGGKSHSLLIGIVARLSPEKGHLYAIEAFHALVKDIQELHLVLVGEGQERANLERQADSLQLADRLHFLGERADARQIIGALDLMVLPSLTEGLPNVVLEAFAYKTPVVATAVGGVPELVKDGETGWLVPPRDPHALAQAIRDALSNPEEARRRAENAYRHLLASFTVEQQVERWEQALRAAVENWQRRRRR